MKNCFLAYDYTSKIFDVFAGKTNKGKVIHTFSVTIKRPSLMPFSPATVSNKAIYQCALQIINYYQNKDYTVHFDEFIARILEKFEPIFKQKRNIEQERSLVETTVIQIEEN